MAILSARIDGIRSAWRRHALPSHQELRAAQIARGRGHSNLHGRPREAGYTLIELLVVLAILALLVGISTPMVLSYLDSSKVSTAKIEISNLSSALELYKLAEGDYPTAQQGLSALLVAPPDAVNWTGPFLKGASGVNDPWGHPFHYRIPGEHGEFDLWSDGPHGTDSDDHPTIANW